MLTRPSATAASQDDLFSEEVSLRLPARWAVDGKVLSSLTRQQAVHAAEAVCRLKPFTIRRVGGFETILQSGEALKILSAKTATQLDADLVLLGAVMLTERSRKIPTLLIFRPRPPPTRHSLQRESNEVWVC